MFSLKLTSQSHSNFRLESSHPVRLRQRPTPLRSPKRSKSIRTDPALCSHFSLPSGRPRPIAPAPTLRRDMPSSSALRTRAAVAATCVAVLAAAAVLLHRRRRRNRAPASPRRLGWRRRRPRRACEEEEKPQDRFKRVLADNSYSAFKHLRRQDGLPGGEATPTLPEGVCY